MTIPLWSEDNLANETCADRTALISVPTTGTYTIGFHSTTPAGGGLLFIDDIKVSYGVGGSCDMSPCIPCEDPGAPVITQVTDPNPCSHGGVRISFTLGTGATRHDLYMDGSLVLSDISSPVVYHSGDTIPHDFVVRAVSGGCYAESDAVQGTDESSPTPRHRRRPWIGTPAHRTGFASPGAPWPTPPATTSRWMERRSSPG